MTLDLERVARETAGKAISALDMTALRIADREEVEAIVLTALRLAASEAAREERERCAKIACVHCHRGDPVEPEGHRCGQILVACDAAAIRGEGGR